MKRARSLLLALALLEASSCARAASDGLVAPATSSPTATKRSDEALDVAVCSRAAGDGDATPTDVELEEGKTKAKIVRVVVRGASDPKAVCAVLHSTAGQTIDGPTLSDNLRAVWKLGTAYDVVATREPAPGGVALAFVVTERRRVASWHVVADEPYLGPSDIANALPKGDREDPYEMWKTSRALQDTLKSQGFWRANVTTDAPERKGAPIDVVFTVKIGEPTLVSSVDVRGLAKLKATDLKGLITHRGDALLEDGPERDALVIAQAAYDRGLIDVKVDGPTLTWAPDRSTVAVAFVVTEGEVYRFGRISVAGELHLTPAEYMTKFIASKPGEVFSRAKIADATAKIAEYHRGLQQTMNVEPETTVHRDARTVDVVINVRPAD